METTPFFYIEAERIIKSEDLTPLFKIVLEIWPIIIKILETAMAYLVLEDGSLYEGISFGAPMASSGEVVFNTGMVGYVETLTDPSYRGQILVLTYPLVGNYGVPSCFLDEKQNLKEAERRIEDKSCSLPPFSSKPPLSSSSSPPLNNSLSIPKEFKIAPPLLPGYESDKIQVAGLIIADYTPMPSHWDCEQSLGEWLQRERIPGLYGVDTRALTKKLRQKGTMLGKIIQTDEDIPFFDPNQVEIVPEVSVPEPLVYNPSGKKRIVLIDCGTKFNIIRSLVQRDCCVCRVPWNYDFFHLNFDGVVISNGPGNPEKCRPTIELTRKCLEQKVPTLGICLGHQIMALAAGSQTFKLKFGHRSQNQPCLEVGTKRCYITAQNHGFALVPDSLPSGWKPWFVNLNDGTNEGLRHEVHPFLSVQFHPEHSPGPVDTQFIFDLFLSLVDRQ